MSSEKILFYLIGQAKQYAREECRKHQDCSDCGVWLTGDSCLDALMAKYLVEHDVIVVEVE